MILKEGKMYERYTYSVNKKRIEELKMFRSECKNNEFKNILWCTSRINALQELLEDYEEEK